MLIRYRGGRQHGDAKYEEDFNIYVKSVQNNKSKWKKDSKDDQDFIDERNEISSLMIDTQNNTDTRYYSTSNFRVVLGELVKLGKLDADFDPDDAAYYGIHWEVAHKNPWTWQKLWTAETTEALMNILEGRVTNDDSHYSWVMKKRTLQFNPCILTEQNIRFDKETELQIIEEKVAFLNKIEEEKIWNTQHKINIPNTKYQSLKDFQADEAKYNNEREERKAAEIEQHNIATEKFEKEFVARRLHDNKDLGFKTM